jgi:hypothetical protein
LVGIKPFYTSGLVLIRIGVKVWFFFNNAKFRRRDLHFFDFLLLQISVFLPLVRTCYKAIAKCISFVRVTKPMKSGGRFVHLTKWHCDAQNGFVGLTKWRCDAQNEFVSLTKWLCDAQSGFVGLTKWRCDVQNGFLRLTKWH